MCQKQYPRMTCLILIVLLVFFGTSCSNDPQKTSPSSQTTKTPTTTTDSVGVGRIIANITEASDDVQRKAALEKMVMTGNSLGLIDHQGNQLNPNTSEAKVSLGPADMELYDFLISEGAGRTIGSVVDFLAASGVILSSVNQAVSFGLISPDIQEYIDWSFRNRSDPKALLGLLLASGTDLKTPSSAPKVHADTLISPIAGLMMMADILIGMPESKPVKANVASWMDGSVHAAGLKETANKIQGLITLVEPVLEISGYPIPDQVKTMVAAFAVSDRLVLKTVYGSSAFGDSLEGIRSIQLRPGKGESEILAAVVLMAPSNKVLTGVPISFSINLLSPAAGAGGAAETLYEDADAILKASFGAAKVEMNGHRIGLTGTYPEKPAFFDAVRTLAENTRTRIAILYASAEIVLPDLDILLALYDEALVQMGQGGSALASLLTSDQVKAYYQTIQQGIKINSVAFNVALLPKFSSLKIEPTALEGNLDKVYTFKATIDPPDSAYVYWTRSDKLPERFKSFIEYYPLSEGETFMTQWFLPGSYEVLAGAYVYDDETYVLQDQAVAKVIIKPNNYRLTLSFDKKGTFSTLDSISFTGKTAEARWPENCEWIWDWGDGSTQSISASSANASHRYAKAGAYLVAFSVRDRVSKEILGKHSDLVQISDLTVLQTMKTLTASVSGYYIEQQGVGASGGFSQKFLFSGYKTVPWTTINPSQAPLKWNGESFTCDFKEVASDGRTTTYSIAGAVTKEADRLLNVTVTVDFVDPHYNDPAFPGAGSWSIHQELVIKDVALTNRTLAKFWGKQEGSSILASYVSYEYESVLINGYKGQGDKIERFDHFDWNNTSQGTANILIEFKK